MHREIVRI